MLSCAGSTWYDASMETRAVDKIYFHCGVASTVVDVACVYFLDCHVDWGQNVVRM